MQIPYRPNIRPWQQSIKKEIEEGEEIKHLIEFIEKSHRGIIK